MHFKCKYLLTNSRVLEICNRLKSNTLLQVLIEKCKTEDDLLKVYDLVQSTGFQDIKSLISKAKKFKLVKLGFESSIYYLSFTPDEEIAKNALQIGLFNLEIMNLPVLYALNVSTENPLSKLLDHFKNGNKSLVEKWMRENEKLKEFYGNYLYLTNKILRT